MLQINSYTLTGAYGRDYQNKTALLADWDAGKDFKILTGPYCSIRDIPGMKEQGIIKLQFWYKKNTMHFEMQL